MNNNVVLITGASSGIGRATAITLIDKGYTVYGAARLVEKMKDLELQGMHVLKMDMADENSIHKGIKKLLKAEKRIDVLFNNAGFGLYGSVEDISLKDARYQFDVNLFGLARLTQLVIPTMRQQGFGTIINTSSMGGKMYTPLGAWYHATKHALEGWSDCLRLELKAFNIDVVIIEPGMIETNFGKVVFGPVAKRSKGGAYEPLVQKILKSVDKRGGYQGSPPAVIAKVVLEAIEAKNPKTRYVAGKYAKLLLFLRGWMPDRFFDWGVMKAFTS